MHLVISFDATRRLAHAAATGLPAATPRLARADEPSARAPQDGVDIEGATAATIATPSPARSPVIALPPLGIPLAGTPVSLAIPALHWPAAAIREVEGHMRCLGLSPQTHAIEDIFGQEVARAQPQEPRVGGADMARAAARAAAAQHLQPVPQTNLFGFTRLIDAKFQFDARVVEALAADVPRDALLQAVDKGPGDGAVVWGKPADRIQLLASLVRQVVLGKGASLQLNISNELAHWMERGVARAGAPLAEAMGGAGAFCANLAAVQPNVTSHFYAPSALPPRVAARFGPEVGIVGADSRVTPAMERADAALVDRVNFSAEYTRDNPLTLYGEAASRVNGQPTPLLPSGNGRVILGTPGANDIGFGNASTQALADLAKAHDIFFFVGSHYLTQGSSLQAQAAAYDLGSQLQTMKSANPTLTIHAQYVIPKVPANEAGVMAALRGHIDSMSLNTVEVPPLLQRLHAAGLSNAPLAASSDRAEAERPAAMIDGAASLKRALGLARVHLHGFDGDLVVVDRPRDKERQVLALLRARQMASMKTANASGEIRTQHDVWPVIPTVEGNALAAVHGFADAMRARFHLDDAAHAAIVENWHHQDDASGETWFFVPSRGIHDRSGGTVSLGDTIDSTALMYGLER